MHPLNPPSVKLYSPGSLELNLTSMTSDTFRSSSNPTTRLSPSAVGGAADGGMIPATASPRPTIVPDDDKLKTKSQTGDKSGEVRQTIKDSMLEIKGGSSSGGDSEIPRGVSGATTASPGVKRGGSVTKPPTSSGGGDAVSADGGGPHNDEDDGVRARNGSGGEMGSTTATIDENKWPNPAKGAAKATASGVKVNSSLIRTSGGLGGDDIS